MSIRALHLVTITLFVVSTATALPAQAVTIKEDKPGMLKLAKITPEAATASALAKVPGGKVDKGEIEKEKGKLIYSFDIKVDGKSGIDEVAVDAITGNVLSVEHESPAAEAKEAAADKAKAAKGAKVTPKVAAPPAPKKP
jgi:hypothetical protein